MELNYQVGVIEVKNLLKFQKALFRSTRGNVFANYFQIKTNQSENLKTYLNRTVVFLTFQSTQSGVLEQKIKKLLELHEIKCYPVPENHS